MDCGICHGRLGIPARIAEPWGRKPTDLARTGEGKYSRLNGIEPALSILMDGPRSAQGLLIVRADAAPSGFRVSTGVAVVSQPA
jgi:hypothetical protein